MNVLSKAGLVLVLLSFVAPAAAQSSVQMRYYEAMAAARAEGLPALVSKLDALAAASPGTAAANLHETIQLIGLLHPGSVPDIAPRLQALRAQAGENPALARALKRLTVLQQYYAAAARGDTSNSSALADPVFEGSVWGVLASADAAMRAGNYVDAEILAGRVIEADPYSPLIASAYVVLGICSSYLGDPLGAACEFQRAFAVSPLPTIYGRTQDYLIATYRFARPVPGPLGNLYDEETATPMAVTQGIKDPRSLIAHDGTFTLVDREQIFAVGVDGKVMDTKAGRRVEDVVSAGAGKLYYLSEDGVDLGNGTWTKLSWMSGGKTKNLSKLRSIALAATGDIYVLDQEAGLLRGVPSPGAVIPMTPVAQARGRLLRIDRRGRFYVLGTDQRSIAIYSSDGKPAATVSPETAAGKDPSIEYFALDPLDHLYILDQASIQVFGTKPGATGLEKARISTVPLDQRPSHRNLRVIAVASDGVVAVTGKNEDNWVIFR
jgi:tetratricopeptide (TPR) repeat protein